MEPFVSHAHACQTLEGRHHRQSQIETSADAVFVGVYEDHGGPPKDLVQLAIESFEERNQEDGWSDN